MFYMNLIATYISGVCIIRAYNIDDFYHTGRIDLPSMVKIEFNRLTKRRLAFCASFSTINKLVLRWTANFKTRSMFTLF